MFFSSLFSLMNAQNMNLIIEIVRISLILIGSSFLPYILSSISFMTPSQYRKMINQEILVSYIDWIQQYGYEKLYIWVCPPTKGDDYILYII